MGTWVLASTPVTYSTPVLNAPMGRPTIGRPVVTAVNGTIMWSKSRGDLAPRCRDSRDGPGCPGPLVYRSCPDAGLSHLRCGPLCLLCERPVQ